MSRFRMDPSFLRRIGRSPNMVQAMGEVAEKVAAEVPNQAPRDEGDYIDSIEAVSGIEGGAATGRVNANDWKSGLIETGTEDTPAFAPLRKAAEVIVGSVRGAR